MGSCRWWKWLISAGFAGLLAACAGTGGLRPQSSLRGADSLAASRTVAAADVAMGEWPRVDWWKQFNDPQLDTLIERGLTGSPSLGIAAARVREALAAAMSERAPLFPRIDGDFESVRQRLSDTGVVSPALAGADWITQTQLETTLKYELDFWGRNRAAYESALGRERAAEVDAFASRLTLSASIALAYARLQHAYLLLDVANATLEQREAVLRLTRQRVGAGLDSRLELKQAEAALPEARERIAQLRGAIGIERDELAALIGEGPDRGQQIERPRAQALAPVTVPDNLSVGLLGRRPDIVAQRLRVEAAQKDIDVARAQFYPDVQLNGFVGLQSIQLPGFFALSNRAAGVGPAVTLPIFEGGRLRGQLGSRDAEYDAAVEQYNQTLVQALREVVDQLTTYRSLREQQVEQTAGLRTAQEAYDLAVLRYREGLGTYLAVLSAETQLLGQRSLQADLQFQQLTVSIELARALGGGFTTPAQPRAETASVR